MGTNECERAIVYYEMAIQMESDTHNLEIGPLLFCNYCQILFDTAQYDKCIKYLHQCIAIFSDSMNDIDKIYFLMAKSYLHIKSKQNLASEWISKACQLKPDNVEYEILYKKLTQIHDDG